MEENNLNVTPSNKQENTGLGILIGLLIAAVVGLSAFIVYDKVLKKDDTNKETTIESTPTPKTVEEKELSVDSEIVKKLSKFMVFVSYEQPDKYNTFYKNDKTILADLPLEFKLSLVATKMEDVLFKEDTSKSDPNNGFVGISFISENDIKEAYKNIFGVNNDYARGTFNKINNCASDYSWSASNNRYEATIPDGCGGSTCWRINPKISSAKEIGNTIEIYQKILVEDDCNGYKLTSDYNRTNVITKSMPSDDSIDNLFKLYGDKADTYKYTFVKDSAGIYVFTSVEKVK